MNICELYTAVQGEGKYTGIPHIVIRFTGCPMRCSFGNSICDSWYTSWSPEKGVFTEQDIEKILKENPQIKHTMITGGEPFVHKELARVVELCKQFDHFVTIETSGIGFIETSADFISLSPKLRSSTPRVGQHTIEWETDNSIKVTYLYLREKDVNRHEKMRKSYSMMKSLIEYYPDYQIKPVITLHNFDEDIKEVEYLLDKLKALRSKTYLMPAGATSKELEIIRPKLIEYCTKNGYNYSDRIHIVAYGNKRGV